MRNRRARRKQEAARRQRQSQRAHMAGKLIRECPMRRFLLNRAHDNNGISGTGIVAEGLEFTSGKCVLCWYGRIGSITVFDSLGDLLFVHGHGLDTVIEWIDSEHTHGRDRRKPPADEKTRQATEAPRGG